MLLQLAYIVWFSQRPADGDIDLLAGRMDGVIWRVTVDDDGRPLLYDSIHACGCYQAFFPTARLRRRAGAGFWEEGALVPASVGPALPVAVRLASATHYIDAVTPAATVPAHALRYRLLDYEALRRQRPRLFDNDGLAVDSERAERWLLWPSGVPSAGAMRQWGHHATAFVGKRHFDEPDLISRYFGRAR